jgi:von Willebrand factor type A domain
MVSLYIDLCTTTDFLIRKLSLSSILVTCLCMPGLAAIKTADITRNPTVRGEKVTVHVYVKDLEEHPVVGLSAINFKLKVDGKNLNFKAKDWKNPQDAIPPPTWIIVLLDMSGSMRNQDSRGTTKLVGALKAIEQFKDKITERLATLPSDRLPKISIVPFGKSGPGCKGFPVKPSDLEKFFSANDFKLKNQLNFLASQVPCASTNIYEPLSKAVNFLGNKNDPRFMISEDLQKIQPRLSIILLSDGFETDINEVKNFSALQQSLNRYPSITVHTLGYGLTLKELGQKYHLGRAATRKDVWFGNDIVNVPKGKVFADEFVDEQHLKEIARTTGGISEFSADAEIVAEKLQLFLNALLGEYEISYIQPSADRGSKHDVNVIVNADGKTTESLAKLYTITVFGRSLPFSIRLEILVGTILIMGFAGFLPFWFWSNKLKQEEL